MASHIEDGLKSIGLYRDTDRAVLHQLSLAMPDGQFDGHRSVVPAPDHPLLHGLSKKLVTALMFMIPKTQRDWVEMSLRDCVRAAQMRRTRLYNLTNGKMYAPSVSEWAAIVSVAPIAFSRSIERLSDPPVGAPVALALSLLRYLSELMAFVYHFPRVDLDGVACCRERKDVGALTSKVTAFLTACQTTFLGNDCIILKTAVDAPNLHRVRELAVVLDTGLGHATHCMELSLESAHQPMKRAISRGNGHDVAGRAMRRMQQMDMMARIASSAVPFRIPRAWMLHPGIVASIQCVAKLHSATTGSWAVAGSAGLSSLVADAAVALAAQFLPASAACVWRKRATRGLGRTLSRGDTIGVLTSGGAGRVCVDVASSRRGPQERVRFFFLEGIFEGTTGASAIVSPYDYDEGSNVYRRVSDKYQILRLEVSVRRALALHCCGSGCRPSMRTYGVTHSQDNVCYILGRRDGYPARSG